MSAKRTKSLTRTLVFAFFLLGLTILTVSSGFEIYLHFRTEQKSIVERQQLIAQQAANKVGNFIEGKFSILEALARLHNFGTSEDIEEFRQGGELEKIIGLEPAFRQLVMLDRRGQELLQVSRLSRAISNQPINKFREEDFDTVDLTRRYISPVYIDHTTNEPMILISVPIKNVFGDLQGILLVETNLKFMWDLVGNIEIGKSGLAYVVNEEGSLLAFGDTSRVLKGESLAHIDEVKYFLEHSSPPEIKKSVFTTGINGTYVVSSHVHLGGPAWAVVVELPIFEAYQDVINTFFLSLSVIIFSIGLVSFVSFKLSKSIAKPILKLRDVAIEIGKGRLDLRAEIESQDEIGELAATFNTMTAGLQKYQMDLREKITQLEQEHSRFLASVNSLQLGFIAVDALGNVIAINPAGLHIFGLQAGGNTLDDIANRLGKGFDLRQSCKRCVDEKVNFDMKEVEYGARFLRIFLTPIHHANTKDVIGTVILVEDITEHKIIERSKDEFFSIASHELRTPLTAIRGNISLIQDFYADKITDPDVKQMLGDIKNASVRLITMVNDFLDVSRLEQNHITMNIKDVDLSVIVAQIVSDSQALASQKGLTLILENPTSPLKHVKGDTDRIRQVLTNLIGNALNYTKQGGAKVKLNEVGAFVKVSISDTGVGISPHGQQLLFRKFQQAGESIFARDNTQSSGLGLYISKLIVEAMGGEIKLEESTPGKGSTFSFALPVSS